MSERIPEGEPAPPPRPPADSLATLRDHVRSAQQAAERLAGENGSTRAWAGSTAASPGGAEAGSGQDASRGGFAHGVSDAGGQREPGDTPPSGWAAPAAGEDAGAELRALVELLESLRSLLPAELREQLNDLIRQVLLLTRAVIDRLVIRLESESQPAAGGESIEDIPIS